MRASSLTVNPFKRELVKESRLERSLAIERNFEMLEGAGEHHYIWEANVYTLVTAVVHTIKRGTLTLMLS